MKVTQIVFEQKKETAIKFHLQPRKAKTVKHLAETRGIAQEALIKEWVTEKLQEHQSKSIGCDQNWFISNPSVK